MDLTEALTFLRGRVAADPSVAVILGSGWGGVADALQGKSVVPFRRIPGFPSTAVEGHAGLLVVGRLEGEACIVFHGRHHLYEGHPSGLLALPVRIAAALGARTLITTNAAGGVNPVFRPGEIMLIRDQLNLMGAVGTECGRPAAASGRREPFEPYDPRLIALGRTAALQAGIPLRLGVYCAVAGPSFETPAEIRMIRQLGADAVGMSTLPETIAACALGLRVLGISLITNRAAGLGTAPLSHHEVLSCARLAEPRMLALIRAIVRALQANNASA